MADETEFVNQFAGGTGESLGRDGVREVESYVVRDSNDILYLHHSDHPNYVLSTQLLNGRNYYHWKRSVEVSLRAKNKLNFVNGKCLKPDHDSPSLAQWERCNSMVMSWLLHSVDKDIAETLLYWDSATEIWNDLRMRFGFPNCARIYQVQKELFTVSQGNLSISSYYTKFKRLMDEYMMLVEMPSCVKCGTIGNVSQLLHNQQVIQFLVGLNDTYHHVRANILMMKPIPDLGEAYNMVSQDETQKELKSSSGIGHDSSALNAQRGSSGRGGYNNNSNSGRGGSSGSSRGGGRGSQSSGSQDRRLLYYCDHCKTHGHTVDRCYKIIGYPSQRTDREKQQKGAYSVNGYGETQQGGSPSNGSQDSGDKGAFFTQEQVNRLLALLSKNEASGSGDNKSSMMSGPFHEQINGSW